MEISMRGLQFRPSRVVLAVIVAFLTLLGMRTSLAATITTTGSGNWSSTVPNAPWPGGTIPAATDNVIIGTGFTLTVDGNRTANAMTVGNGSTLTVNTGVVLTITTSISFPNLAGANTTGTIAGAGTVNAATMTIAGSVAPTSSQTATVTSTIAALTITNTLTITSQRPAAVTNNPTFQIQSGTVTVNGTLTCVTANNAASTTLVTLATGAQSGTLQLGNVTPISTSGNAGVSTFTFTGTTATVNYTGAAQTVYNVNYTNLTLSGSGIKTLQTGTTAIGGNFTLSGTASTTTVANIAITGNLSIGDGTTFTAAGFNLSVTGTTTIGAGTSGQLTFSSATGTKTFGSVTISAAGTWSNPVDEAVSIGGNLSAGAGATFSQGVGLVTFTGATSNTVTNTGILAFGGGITVNKGTSQANVIDFQGPITMASGGLTLTNGTFKLSSASTITAFNTDPNFGTNAQLWCNGGTILTGNTTVTYSGAIQITSGTVTIGMASDNYLFPNGGTLTINGGTLNVAGELSDSATGFGFGMTFSMSSGVCIVNTAGGGSQDYPFYIDAFFGSTFSMTGGYLVIQNPTSAAVNAGYHNYATSTFTGGTLQIGNTGTAGTKTIGIDTTNPIYNLTVNSANVTTQVQTQAITVSNNLAITQGALTANGFDISVGGNWSNSGTFTPTAATVTLSGAAQTISGNSTTFYNLVLGGTSTKTFSVATTMSNNLSISTGVVANLSTITTHTTKTLTLGGVGQTATGSWGGTTSGATNINSTFFATATGRINSTNVIYYSRQTGNWNAATTWSTVTYAGAAASAFPVAGDVVNIGGGSFTITVNVNSACGSLTYQSNATFSPTVSINSGITLAVSGAITIPRASGTNPDVNTLAVGAGILTAGSLSFTNGGIFQRHIMTISTGTATISGDVTQSGSFGSATITISSTGTLNLGGAFLDSSNGTLNAGNGTVNYNGAAQTVGDFTYNNLTLSGSGAKDLSTQTTVTNINNNFVMSGTATAAPVSGLTIGGAVTLGAGTTFTAGALTHNVAGNWTNNGGTFTNTGSTINFNGAAQSIGGSSSTTFANVTMTGSGTKTYSIATFVSGNLSIATSIVLNPGAIITHTARTLTLGGNGQLGGTYGSTSSVATNKNNTFFTAGTIGIVTVSNTAYYTRQTGNWNAAATWSNATYGGAAASSFPVAGDDVNIGGGNYTVTVNVNSACGTLSYQSNNGFSPIVTINSGITLTVSGAITIPRAAGPGTTNVNTLTVGAGTLSAGSLAFTNSGGNARHVVSITTGTATITGDITADAGSTGSPTINITSTGTLNVGGAFLNSTNGTVTTGTGTVNYNGTVAQTIGDFAYYNLTLNNTFATAPQFTLFGNTTVSNVLTMTKGVVNLSGFTLTLSSSASGALVHSLASTAGWVYNGTFTRAFPATAITVGTSQDGLMPMGTSADFRPFFFGKTNTGGSSGTISMNHVDPTGSVTGLSISDTSPVATIIIRDNAVWTSTLTGGTGATFGVRYGGTGLGTVSSLNDVRSMLAGSVIGTNVTATTVSTSDPRVERSGLTASQMSNGFYVGSTNAATSLPIELISFTGTAGKLGVDLQWQTSSELNNDNFTVTRSSSGANFLPLGVVQGNGTTHQAHDYHFTDFHPVIGNNYYQLVQRDLDGKMTTSEIIVVNVTSLDPLVSIYPNPVSQKQWLTIEVNAIRQNAPADVVVYNTQGAKVMEATASVGEDGTLKVTLAPGSLAPGLYLVTVQGIRGKIVVE